MTKKPKTDAVKRVRAARNVGSKVTKAPTTPTTPTTPTKAKAPGKAPSPSRRASELPSRAAKSEAPKAKDEVAKIAAVQSAPLPTTPESAAREGLEDAKPKPEPGAAKKRARVGAEAATQEEQEEQDAQGVRDDYWSSDKSEPKAPLELRIAPEVLSFEGAADAATIAPPKRTRKESVPPEGDEEIWSDNPVPSALVREEGSRLTHGFHGDRSRAAAELGGSQSLLSTDYYFRQYGPHGMRSLSAEVDDFGFDPHVDEKLRPFLDLVSKKYFRVELLGAEQLPAVGRALLVANRGGTLPWDGLVLRSALRNARPELSPVRWLAEDSVIHYPFMGVVMNRLGAVRACPENAERLLAQDRLVTVFPEGAQGSRKLFRDRYRLQRFGRGGYVKLALKLGAPIFPTAIIGAEETNPVLYRSRLLGRLVGSDTVPITATFPWLGLAGLLPAPVRWRIAIGEPIDLSSYGPHAADDALVVHRLNEQIRSALQALVDENKTARGRSLFG
jgi:1-acyl-sn-glycerol-3-phosphate acyltransferase